MAARVLRRAGARRAFSAEPAPAYASERINAATAPTLMEIGCRDIFDEDHDAFRQMCRDFFANEVKPFHKEWEKAGEVPRELWTKAGDLGLLACMVPEAYGGLGTDCRFPAVVWEEQSYSGCTGPGFAMHSDIVAPYITNYGTEEQKQRILPKLVSGEWIGFGMTEPSAGSDFANIKTTAVKDGDDYVINGSKVFITNGWMADVTIVCAKTDASKGAHGVSLFLIEDGMKGFTKGNKLEKMGMKAQDTCELFFEDLRVPKRLIADMGVSAAEAVFEWTRDYTMDRSAFKGKLSNLQVVGHKLAEMKTDICVGRAFVDNCIALHSQHKLDSVQASMAKYWCTDLQCKIADAGPIYGGANEIMKELISRSITNPRH
ncbi:isovaleryl-CoA dehydrogenase [Aureococcus anophagefferens]|nr:isovaleryl-CoA dehydrogenase [Aureococcus anophagefferens]